MSQSSGNQPSIVEQIKFLSDLPLTGDKEQEMRFGHPSIVDNLRKIICTCPTPFTIGLFAKWGTGKTTILDAVKNKFHATEIAVVKIDAWKLEGDALRRTFLQDTIIQLQEEQDGKLYLSTDVKLSENWRTPIIRTFQSGFKFEGSIKKALIGFLIALVGGGALILGLWPQNFGTYFSIVFGGGLLGGIILALLQKAITTETTTTMTDRFKDPQEFEAEFVRIIDLIQAERLLVIVDNLDRVSCENAIELLATIKTFMEHHKCVFLIACDAEAIKRHLESIYTQDNQENGSRFDGDEFLRKFFNGYLFIPDFIDTELQDYTEDLLKETNLRFRDSPDIAFVITVAFRENPRQIKQFINTLISHYLLAEAREAAGALPKGSVTGNVAYLAKHLVIRQQYPEYYENDSESVAMTNTKSKDKWLNSFLSATKPVTVENVRPFRYLKLSQAEIDMPEIIDLQLAMQENDVESVQKIMRTYQEDRAKLAKFGRFVLSFIARNRGRGLVLSNIVSSTLFSLKRLDLKLNKHFYQQVAELLSDDEELGTKVSSFDPIFIFDQIISQCSIDLRNTLFGKYVGLFSSLEGVDNPEIEQETYGQILLHQFMEHKEWLSSEQKSEVRQAIEEKHFRYKMLSLFIGKKAEQKEFISETALGKFIISISPDDVESQENLRLKVRLLSEFDETISHNNLVEMTSKLGELLELETAKPYREEKINLMTCIDGFFSYFSDRLARIPGENKNEFATKVLNSANALQNWEEKVIFLPICIWLTGILVDPVKSQIESVVTNIFSNANIDGLKYAFAKMKTRSVKEKIITKFESIFRQRSVADDAIYDELYPLASKEIRTQWIAGLIQSDHERVIRKLQELKFKIDDRKSVVSALLNKADQLPLEQRENLYSTCNSLNCANDVTLKEKLASNIKVYLRSNVSNAQTIGLNILKDATHLSATQKRDIATDTIDWLSSLQPDIAFQSSSIQSVLEILDILPWAPRQKFLDFVFDKLIKRGISVQNIDFGFNILIRYEPKIEYEQYQTYFDDIWSRVESEADIQIKVALVNGLTNQMPARTNSRNKDYWAKVKDIQISNTTSENE